MGVCLSHSPALPGTSRLTQHHLNLELCRKQISRGKPHYHPTRCPFSDHIPPLCAFSSILDQLFYNTLDALGSQWTLVSTRALFSTASPQETVVVHTPLMRTSRMWGRKPPSTCSDCFNKLKSKILGAFLPPQTLSFIVQRTDTQRIPSQAPEARERQWPCIKPRALSWEPGSQSAASSLSQQPTVGAVESVCSTHKLSFPSPVQSLKAGRWAPCTRTTLETTVKASGSRGLEMQVLRLAKGSSQGLGLMNKQGSLTGGQRKWGQKRVIFPWNPNLSDRLVGMDICPWEGWGER